MTTWICSKCSKPLASDGYVLIRDAERGGYPRRATATGVTLTPAAIEQRRVNGQATEPPWGGVFGLNEVALQPDQIAFEALHRKCDPNKEGSEYWIGIERLATLEDWCSLVHHVSSKTWMSTIDIGNMIEFWFKNRGLRVPSI